MNVRTDTKYGTATLVSQCLETSGHHSKFRFRGVFKSKYISSIVLTPDRRLEVNENYIIQIIITAIIGATMFGTILKHKPVEEMR